MKRSVPADLPPAPHDLYDLTVDMAKASRLWEAITPELRDRLVGPDAAERR